MERERNVERFKGALRRKMLTTHAVVYAALLSVLLLVSYFGVYGSFGDRIGQERRQIAQRAAMTVSVMFDNEVRDVEVYVSNVLHHQRITEVAARYVSMRPDEIARKMLEADPVWASAAPSDPLIKDFLENPSAQRLRMITAKRDDIGEIFITDRFGGLAAASDKTSDFYQGDEDWWRRAWNIGRGAVYVGTVEFDESSTTYGIPIAVPVRDAVGKQIGVCKMVVASTTFFAPIARVKIGGTGYAAVVDETGDVLFEAGRKPLTGRLLNAGKSPNFLHLSAARGWERWRLEGRDVLVSAAPLEDSILAANDLRWWIVVIQDMDEIIGPMNRLFFTITVFCIVTYIVFMLSGFFFIGFYMSPLEALRDTMEKAGGGDHSARAVVKSGDDIERLANSFNEMIERMRKATYSRDHVRGVISNILDALLVVDPDGQIRIFNDAAVRMSGFAGDELLGRPISMLLSDGEIAYLGKKLSEEGSVISYEAGIKTRSGGSVPVILSVSVLKEKSETSIVIVAKDITEHRRQERALQEKQKELIEVNRELTSGERALKNMLYDLKVSHDDLKSAQQQLIQFEKLRTIGTLASGVAHEVKNPLGIILLAVNFLESQIDPSKTKERETLAMMKTAIGRANSIIRGLLDFSRQSPLDQSECELRSIIEAALTLVTNQMAFKDIEVVTEFSDGGARVLVDRTQIEQALVNVVMNAAQAMEKGGTLTVRTFIKDALELKDGVGRRAIEFFLPGEKGVVCEIADTGCGIVPEMVTKIFDPFYTTKPPGQGVGLGLSITRSIIDSNRGLIGVASESGKGTVMTITLPLVGH